MTETAQNPTSTTRPSRAKPVGQLMATLLLLLIHVVAAVTVIAAVKAGFDRRFDRTFVDETLANALALVDQGHAGDAESRVTAIIQQRPQLETPIAWGLTDHLVTMPQLTRKVSGNLRQKDMTSNGSFLEHAIRMETTLRTNRWLDTRGVLREVYPILPRPYAYFTACEIQDFSVVKALSDPSNPIDLAPLPPTALPRTASPLALLAPIQNGTTQIRAPSDVPAPMRDYYLGAVAFYQGRLDQAQQFLLHDWEQPQKRPDTAYLLGAIAEANDDKETARQWYGKALSTGATHLAAAQGYVRVGVRD